MAVKRAAGSDTAAADEQTTTNEAPQGTSSGVTRPEEGQQLQQGGTVQGLEAGDQTLDAAGNAVAEPPAQPLAPPSPVIPEDPTVAPLVQPDPQAPSLTDFGEYIVFGMDCHGTIYGVHQRLHTRRILRQGEVPPGQPLAQQIWLAGGSWDPRPEFMASPEQAAVLDLPSTSFPGSAGISETDMKKAIDGDQPVSGGEQAQRTGEENPAEQQTAR